MVKDRKHGFTSLSQWAAAVKASSTREITNPHTARALSTYGSEGVSAEGGFAVPPAFVEAIERRLSVVALVNLCDVRTLTGGSVAQFPVDNTAPWATSGGVLAEHSSEADTLTQRKPSLEQADVPLERLTCLIPIVGELAEDNGGAAGYLERRIAEAIGWQADFWVLQGLGAGHFVGIKNASCTISVTRNAAGDVQRVDLATMLSRFHMQNRDSTRWLVHPSTWPKIAAAVPEVIPTGQIFGIPVISHQGMEALGTAFDVALCDFSGYLIATRGMTLAQSIHFWFDQDVSAFRGSMRAGGQPWLSAALSNRTGGSTVSPFVVLGSA